MLGSRNKPQRITSYKAATRARSDAARSARRAGYASYSMARYNPRSVIKSGTQWYLSTKLFQGTTTLTSTSAAPGYYSFSFRCQDIPDFTSVSALWDQYRIEKITAYITPMNTAGVPTTSAPPWATLWSAIDYDDALVPTTVSQVMQYANSVQTSPMTGPMIRSWKPKYRGFAYNGSAGVQSSILGGFIDLAAGDIEHYGLKIAVMQSTSTSVTYYQIYFKYEISFKKLR